MHHIRDWILPVIDFFYPPFRKIFSRQMFRYAASGGGNVVLGFLVYSLSFEYLFNGKLWELGSYAIKPHSAALFLSFCVTFPIGFFMSKYVCQFNLFLNWILLKIGVESLGIHALPAQLLTIVIVVMVSYLAQRYFSFRSVPIKD
jgi:putative flippase GtrA